MTYARPHSLPFTRPDMTLDVARMYNNKEASFPRCVPCPTVETLTLALATHTAVRCRSQCSIKHTRYSRYCHNVTAIRYCNEQPKHCTLPLTTTIQSSIANPSSSAWTQRLAVYKVAGWLVKGTTAARQTRRAALKQSRPEQPLSYGEPGGHCDCDLLRSDTTNPTRQVAPGQYLQQRVCPVPPERGHSGQQMR